MSRNCESCSRLVIGCASFLTPLSKQVKCHHRITVRHEPKMNRV